MANVGGREGKSKSHERERDAVADLQEEMRREAEAHFRWAREAKLRREAESRGAFTIGAPASSPPSPPSEPPPPAVPAPPPVQAVHAPPAAEAPPAGEAPRAAEAPPAGAPPAEAPVALPLRAAALAGLQPTFEAQWQQLERNRRDLLSEWARLSKARERIETTYERLDDLREQLDAERRQLERERERLWMGRFQLVNEAERAEPRPVAADRPWRDVATHLVEAAVVVRAVVAQRGPRLVARLRGRAARRPLTGGWRRELPPGR
jgi:hypothetical protein